MRRSLRILRTFFCAHIKEMKMEKKCKPIMETRVLKIAELRVKFGKDDEKPMITGYAAVFNKLSEDLGGFREKIKPGAFKAAILSSDTRGLFNHDPNYVLGRQSNETLRLKEDDNGLYMEVDPPDTQIIRDLVMAPIQRGDIREQSFAFIIGEDDDEWEGLDEKSIKEGKMPIRTINNVFELYDVSPVTYPAYPDTAVAVRSLKAAREHMDALPFAPLTIPELFRNYADEWQTITDSDDEDHVNAFKELREKIMAELNEQFPTSAEPTQGDVTPTGDPTKAPSTGEPTQADLEARDRLEKLNERFNKMNLKR